MAQTDYFSANSADCASIAAFQTALREVEDELNVITAIGQDFDELHPDNCNNWCQYDLPLQTPTGPSAIELRPLPADYDTNPNGLDQFLANLRQTYTIVDLAVLMLGAPNAGVDTAVVLLRPGATPVPPTPQPVAADMPALPDFVKSALSASAGVPWTRAKALSAMNGYSGIVPDSFRIFDGLKGPDGNAMKAIFYVCKFDKDNDGSGGNAGGDHSHQDNTSLRDEDGDSLDASTDRFAVYPMDAADALRAHLADPRIATKLPGLPNFTADLGLCLGDLGKVFWHDSQGQLLESFFIYGDEGPANKLGEGSIRLGQDLGMSADPNNAEVDAASVKQTGIGVVHIGFPGSGRQFMVAGSSVRSRLVPAHIMDTAAKFYQAFLSQPPVAGPIVPPAGGGGGGAAPPAGGAKAQIVSQSVNEWIFWGNSVPGNIGKVESDPAVISHIDAYWATGVGTTPQEHAPGDYETPWSAAFISWCMRTGGAGGAFHYSAQHSVYISRAIQDRENGNTASSFLGFRLTEYAPKVGDLVCWAREPGVSYNNQKNGDYEGHCDLVVAVNTGNVEIIGGNVSNSVTRRHLPTNADGLLLPVGQEEYLIAVMQNKLT